MNQLINLIVPAGLFGIFSFVTWLAVLQKLYPKLTKIGEEQPNRSFLVKRGELSWPHLNEELPVLIDEIEKLAVVSSLPEQPDRKFWDEFILETCLCKKLF